MPALVQAAARERELAAAKGMVVVEGAVTEQAVIGATAVRSFALPHYYNIEICTFNDAYRLCGVSTMSVTAAV